MERINLFFHGQDISVEEKSKCKAQLAYLLRKAPSDSSMCCCISSEKEGLAANIKVHSAQGHISIHRESKDIDGLLNYVTSGMNELLKKWHEDPAAFEKNHPLVKSSCRAASDKNLQCPINSYGHEEH